MTKSRPILFSPGMSLAVRENRKTQTRRSVKIDQTKYVADGVWRSGDEYIAHLFMDYDACHQAKIKCPYGEVGDLLWVREEHYRFGHWRALPGMKTKTGKQKWAFIADTDEVRYCDNPPTLSMKSRHPTNHAVPMWHKRLARFMPRSLCRTTLEITEIRIERLWDISEADVEAEGIERRTIDWHGKEVSAWASAEEWGDLKIGKWSAHEVSHFRAPQAYACLWNKINGHNFDICWENNPWVWVICFKLSA